MYRNRSFDIRYISCIVYFIVMCAINSLFINNHNCNLVRAAYLGTEMNISNLQCNEQHGELRMPVTKATDFLFHRSQIDFTHAASDHAATGQSEFKCCSPICVSQLFFLENGKSGKAPTDLIRLHNSRNQYELHNKSFKNSVKPFSGLQMHSKTIICGRYDKIHVI